MRARQREFRGRIQRGQRCTRCSSKHIKCDGSAPCKQCLRANAKCSLTSAALTITAELSRSPSPPQVNRAIHDFYLKFVHSWVDDNPAKPLFRDFALPATQMDGTVFNALSSWAMVVQLPLADAMRCAVPTRAIEHYCRSLEKPLTDVNLLILTTMLYISIESRLAHIQNMEILYRSAFAIIHSTPSLWKDLKNHRLCLCIRHMLIGLFMYPINPACIARSHWASTMSLMLGMTAEMTELDDKFSMGLYVEVANILYDLNHSFDVDLEYRMRAWKQRYSRIATYATVENQRYNSIHLMKFYLDGYEMVWNSYYWHFHDSMEHGELVLKKVIQDVEMIEQLPDRSHFLTATDLEMALIPRSIQIIYHARDEGLAQRLKGHLALYKRTIRYYNRMNDYIDELVQTPYGQPTSLELEAFGDEPPLTLQPWQCRQLTQYLARS